MGARFIHPAAWVRTCRFWLLLAVGGWAAVLPSRSDVVIHLPRYKATTFGVAPNYISDIRVDSAGMVVASGPMGVIRYDLLGNPSTWTGTPAYRFAMQADGSALIITSTEDVTKHSIQRLAPDGTLSPVMAPSAHPFWAGIALSPGGEVYAFDWAGSSAGLYRLRIAQGAFETVAKGGPGPAGQGYYRGMLVTPDGRIFVTGSDGYTNGLFRWDQPAFTRVAVLPHAGIGLAQDDLGTFYAATTSEPYGEVWRIDLAAGKTELLASGLSYPAAITFEPNTHRLFVGDQLAPFRITAISVPTTHPATVLASMDHGAVSAVAVVDGGFGYTNAPTVLLLGGGGSGATAHAVIDQGRVVAIVVDRPGAGYTTTPVARIGSPDGLEVPTLSVHITRVSVELHVKLGARYQLLASQNLSDWTPAGDPFEADQEVISREFDATGGRVYYRLAVLP